MIDSIAKKVRTRIAPSPTGFPHIGTIYQALFNYAFAKKHDGRFLVRIEDTDRSRFVQGAEEVIYTSLDWFGLVEDESPRKSGDVGPYRQSERLPIYHKYVQQLLDDDKAYFSYYAKESLSVKKDYSDKKDGAATPSTATSQPTPPKSVADMPKNGDWVVRMRVPREGTITFRDEIRGDISFDAAQVTEQVLLKSDTFPTYHLAVVVDDHLMGITHVVRAEEWISSTPKHVLLYQYFGWELPLFFHTPDLRNPDKSKLSKRHGHTNVTWYRDQGYLPEVLINFLALLGWSHPEGKEIFSLSEFTQMFDMKDIHAVGPIFDLTKLTWMNGEYIRALSETELKEKLQVFYKDDTEALAIINTKDSKMQALLDLAKTRMKTLKDFKQLFFAQQSRAVTLEEKMIGEQLTGYLKSISKTDWESVETLLSNLKSFTKEHEASMKTLYFLLTGKEQGLPLIEQLQIYGKDDTIEMVKKRL